jgi:hypothetical protein
LPQKFCGKKYTNSKTLDSKNVHTFKIRFLQKSVFFNTSIFF